MARVFLILAVMASLSYAQDARAVLERIAANAAGTEAWHLAGSTRTTLGTAGNTSTLDVPFRVFWQRPDRLRYEIPGGRKAGVLVCDGQSGWTRLPGNSSRPVPAESLCSGRAGIWESLTDGLLSARFDGLGTAVVEGREQPCEIISAQYSVMRGLAAAESGTPWPGDFNRTLCVDRVRQIVLRDEIEGTIRGNRAPLRVRQITTYDLIDDNPVIGGAAFRAEFPVPPVPEPPLFRPLPPAGASGAELIFRREAEYTPEARTLKFQGTASIRLMVGADGIPRAPHLMTRLPYGLDRKAIEAVCDWRFEPATEHGRRVSSYATVEIAFRLTGE